MLRLLKMLKSMPLLHHTQMGHVPLQTIPTRTQLQTPGRPTHQTQPQVVCGAADGCLAFAQFLGALGIFAEHAGGFVPLFVTHPVESVTA